jgi:hypothetical protein
MKALRLSFGAAHEIVAHLLVSFFDLGKHLLSNDPQRARVVDAPEKAIAGREHWRAPEVPVQEGRRPAQ